MGTEYKLSYTGADINTRLGKIPILESDVNALTSYVGTIPTDVKSTNVVDYIDEKTSKEAAAIVDSAPEMLDTLNELASALNNDANFATTVTNELAKKQNTITGAATTIIDSNLETNKVLVSNGSGKVAESEVTSTELGYLDGVTSNIQTQINELFTSVSDGKATVASAITDKGIETASDATFETLAANVAVIETGIDTSDATAAAGDIRWGKTAYVNGSKETGLMPNVTLATPSISVSSAGLITALNSTSAGYVSAGTTSSTLQLTTQAAKTITPGTSAQTAVASGRYTTGAVTVAGDTNLVAENIVSGKSIFGVSGSAATGVKQITVAYDQATLQNLSVYQDGDYIFDGKCLIVTLPILASRVVAGLVFIDDPNDKYANECPISILPFAGSYKPNSSTSMLSSPNNEFTAIYTTITTTGVGSSKFSCAWVGGKSYTATSDGIVFMYTPSITTTAYDLVITTVNSVTNLDSYQNDMIFWYI